MTGCVVGILMGKALLILQLPFRISLEMILMLGGSVKKNGKMKILGLKDYPLLIEAGTDEYRAKKNIQVEKIDSKGVFRRSRVLDQTKFDELFLSDKINKFQYSAAEMYLNLMKISFH